MVGGSDVPRPQNVGSGIVGSSDDIDDDRSTSVENDASFFLVSKMRDMHRRMRGSAFHLRPSGEIPDVVRYSSVDDDGKERKNNKDDIDVVNVVLRHCLGGKRRTMGEGGGMHVPEELSCPPPPRSLLRRGESYGVSHDDSGGGGVARLRSLNLAELAAKIGDGGAPPLDDEEDANATKRPGGVDGEGGDEGDEYGGVEDGEESDGEDYAANYYESEGDEMSSGSDGEPTF